MQPTTPAAPTTGPQRPSSDEHDSDGSQATLQQTTPQQTPQQTPPAHNYSRPAIVHAAQSHTSLMDRARLGHRPRQRSQGCLEPGLASMRGESLVSSPPPPHLSASQMAAQAAYSAQHMRKRSTTVPAPVDSHGHGHGHGHHNASAPAPAPAPAPGSRSQPLSPPPTHSSPSMTFRTNGMTYQQTAPPTRSAAATAANAAFPASPLASPGLAEAGQASPRLPAAAAELVPQKAPKEKSKTMKLFSSSKPKRIELDKPADKKHQALPSPGKMGIGIHSAHALNRVMNQSTTSLLDSAPASSSASLYASAGASLYASTNASTNASTSTLVAKTEPHAPEPKEKHKHHFLSRTKAKLKDKDDHALPLSSANSTSRPTNPNAPESLYNFAPSSPLPGSSFPSSVTGLDLRHGGRGLREAKKNAKAAAYLGEGLDASFVPRPSFSTERAEWPSLAGSLNSTPGGTAPGASMAHTAEMMQLGASFGITGMSPDDAWPLLKARVLSIFEGEDPRPPVQDFNALVTVHIKRCIHKRSPILLIEDLNELLYTGFGSLDQTLRHIPDERLIPHLVEMWLVVFTTILPFLQAVFLPLDLEFRGVGIMSSIQASEFWGVVLPDEMNTKSPTHKNMPILGELDVRRITLLMFRDIVILPRCDSLMAIFSRLSLENLNAGLESPSFIPDARPGTASSASDALSGLAASLGTNAASLGTNGASLGTNAASHSSAGYLESTSSSLPPSGRSRATSNTSAGSFSSNPHSHPATLHPPQSLPHSLRLQPMDSAKVTETVGRMLQCVSVLVSLQSADESQDKMARMSKELKYNWLGRGRTGRQRQGFVGPRRGGGLPLGSLSLNLNLPEETDVGA
ncbi:HbrB-like protein [Didymella exigua CBS 183.55]|uniref:HbrB-like protein n=1 Tax=Didymella exigua CBS 183.55 TaxID=1150837 RepID=A0A6A5RII5_9PLEO|nr:HbrB-like protein [Didymella exigua CBS 183.55]KAF1925407.1 HbrB-like protein [Didymella exigua CBS 183.55]